MQIGAGWKPHPYQPSGRYATESDQAFLLGPSAAQTTLPALALALAPTKGARVKT